MAHTLFAQGDGAFASVTWNTLSGGGGSNFTPATGDTCDLNNHAITFTGNDLTSAALAMIRDTIGTGSLTPVSTGSYTIGTAANPTIVQSSSNSVGGMLVVGDDQAVILNGQVINNASSNGTNYTAVITCSSSVPSASLTINTSAGQTYGIINHAPAAALDNNSPCAVIASGSGNG